MKKTKNNSPWWVAYRRDRRRDNYRLIALLVLVSVGSFLLSRAFSTSPDDYFVPFVPFVYVD